LGVVGGVFFCFFVPRGAGLAVWGGGGGGCMFCVGSSYRVIFGKCNPSVERLTAVSKPANKICTR